MVENTWGSTWLVPVGLKFKTSRDRNKWYSVSLSDCPTVDTAVVDKERDEVRSCQLISLKWVLDSGTIPNKDLRGRPSFTHSFKIQ